VPTNPSTQTQELLARLGTPQTSNNKRSILVVGRPGSGKTHAVLDVPGPVLFISADTNRDTLIYAMEQRSDITEIHISDWKKDWYPLRDAIKNRELDYETIFVDTYTSFSGVLVDGIAAQAGGKLDFDQWGEILTSNRNACFELVQACRPYKERRAYNVVVTCHLADIVDKKTKSLIRYGPQIAGSFREEIEGKFDFVLLADSEVKRVPSAADPKVKVPKKSYFLRTIEPSTFYTCKARSEWPARVENLGEILGFLDGGAG